MSRITVRKLSHWWEKMRYAPIEVFVFHVVSDVFDERRNKRIDWSQTKEFEDFILSLKTRYRFVPLQEAYRKLRRPWWRRRRYAVLTCDDGDAAVLGVLPFLRKEQIPVTLFINPKYLDGKSRREGYAEDPQYITHDQLWSLSDEWVTVGMHGYEHLDAKKQSVEEFEESVEKCIELLHLHPGFVPFFAYTWGRYTNATQQTLWQKGIVPVLTDGESNYRYRKHYGIGRKPIDSYYWKKYR
jgi:peptidoglycan/xylan/chitin deacetylase (PgdA/CDA1 family)